MGGAIRLGTAGWVYAPWRGSFYPEGLKQKDELAHASAHLGSIEINATFRQHQSPQSFARWAAEAPEGFVFSVKGHQLVTHLKRLKDVEVPLANMFGSGVLALGSRLGPFCWQLPPNVTYDAERMEAFLQLLPHTPDALVELARKADERLGHPPFLEVAGVTQIRHAIEVRHESFATPAFLTQLRRHNVALVASDTAEWPHFDQTADFAYLRLQGAPGAERYDGAQLKQRGGWIADLSAGRTPDAPRLDAAEKAPPARDVYAYFVSTDKEHAPHNARAVMAELGLRGPGER